MKPRWPTRPALCPLRRPVRRAGCRGRRRLSLARRRRARAVRPLLHQRHDRQSQGRALRASVDGAPRDVDHRARTSSTSSARSVMLPVVPMFHANSWCIPYAAALTGFKLVICGDNQPERLCRLFNEEGVTHSAGVPTVWLGMIDHVEATGARARQAGQIVIGGSSAPPATIRWFQKRGIRVSHLWGMTEMSPVGTVGAPPAQLGFDERGRAVRVTSRVPAARCSGSSCEPSTTRATSFRATARARAACRRAAPRWSEALFQAGRGLRRRRPMVRHRRRRGHPSRRVAPDHRSRQGRDQVRRRVDQLDRARECRGRLPRGARGGGDRHSRIPKWDERPLLLIVRDDGSDVCEAEIRDFLSGRSPNGGCPTRSSSSTSCRTPRPASFSKKDLRDKYRDYRFANAEAMVGRD